MVFNTIVLEEQATTPLLKHLQSIAADAKASSTQQRKDAESKKPPKNSVKEQPKGPKGSIDSAPTPKAPQGAENIAKPSPPKKKTGKPKPHKKGNSHFKNKEEAQSKPSTPQSDGKAGKPKPK